MGLDCLVQIDPPQDSTAFQAMPRSLFQSLILFHWLVLALSSAVGQTANALPSLEDVTEAVAKLGLEEEPSPEVKELANVTQDLLNALQAREAQIAAKARFSKQRAAAGEALAKATSESDKLYVPRQPEEGASLEELVKTSETIELERKAESAKLQELTAEATRRTERTEQLPEQIVAARNELERLRGLPSDPPPSDPVLSQRKAELRQANIERQQAVLNTFEEELAFYAEASETLNAEVALSEQKLERLTTEAKVWQDVVSNAPQC